MKILLFGITEFCTYILINLLSAKYRICGLVVNQSNNNDIQEMKEIVKHRKIPLYELGDRNDPGLVDWVKKLSPDLIVLLSFDMLIPKKVYSLAKIAAINFHPSLLPHYRGYHPYFWPIANGEELSGVTFHYLTDKFDEGDIIAQEKVEILPDDTSGTVIHKEKAIAWRLLGAILKEISNTGRPPGATPQPKGKFIKAPKVRPRDYVIDWSWPSQKILDRIRALNPHSPAFTFFRGEAVGVYQADRVKTSAAGAPGAILELSQFGPVVKTGDGALVLKVVMAGKRYILTGHDFQRREKIQLPARLGT